MIELKAYTYDDMIDGDADIDVKYYKKEDADTAIATLQGANDEKTERIMELQKQVDELDVVKKSAELILQDLLDCGLIKEWYFNGKFNAVLKADDPHLQIEELKQKLEDVQASMYCDVVDVNMENRRLRRALWIARAERAKDRQTYYTHTRGDGWVHKVDQWIEVERKCLNKAEEYR